MSDPLKLPGRTPAEEDAWVDELMEGAPERSERAVRLALSAGRPQLAGRIVGLLSDADIENDEELERAKKAAGLMMIVECGARLDALTEELKILFERRRRRRMQRARRRSRERIDPKTPRDRRRKR